jgi:hypothetical protein
MFISKAGRPPKVAKEMHPSIIHALIDVCSKTRSSIMDLSASTGMCSFSKNSFIISTSNFLYNHISPQHYQGLPKPWAPHPGFGVGYGSFYASVGASH